MHDFTWPQAVVTIVGIICASLVMISFIITASGSRFPWEK